LVGSFVAEFAMTVDRWTESARALVNDWPDDPSQAAQISPRCAA
jgi:hypothetical protein